MCVKRRETWLPLHKICMLVPHDWSSWLNDWSSSWTFILHCVLSEVRGLAWHMTPLYCPALPTGISHTNFMPCALTMCTVPLPLLSCPGEMSQCRETTRTGPQVQREDEVNLCNPAYGRHWISWPVQIIAPKLKKDRNKKDEKIAFLY